MPGRIIVADDVATNRIVLKVKLSAASYDVIQVGGPISLVDEALKTRPDLILLDGNFRTDRCIDDCHELNEHQETAQIPVIILAGDFTPAERLAALYAGASDVLCKPVADDVLLARIRNSMRVRGIEEEIQMREHTAVELGFSETKSEFTHTAQLLVVNGNTPMDQAWQEFLSLETPCTIKYLDLTTVLDVVTRQNMRPDLILLPADIRGQKPTWFYWPNYAAARTRAMRPLLLWTIQIDTLRR